MRWILPHYTGWAKYVGQQHVKKKDQDATYVR